MGDSTGIEWADATWNPLTGCTKVSPGCDHCYAETLAERFRGTPGHYYEGGFDLQLRPQRLEEPLRWTRPRKVFVNSMSDLFHDGVPEAYIAQVFAVMALAPRHTFQLLTKRHARMRSLLSSTTFRIAVEHCIGWWALDDEAHFQRAAEASEVWPSSDRDWPLRNVWVGVSVETQQWADIRVPALLATPAAVRFLSCEPLLGPVDLGRGLEGVAESFTEALDWVIVGGESGRGARPMHPGWATSLRDQCTAAGVPFLFKQWGEWAPLPELEEARVGDLWLGGDGVLHQPWAPGQQGAPAGRWAAHADHLLRRVGKKAAGRLLGGRTWDEYPAAKEAEHA